MPPRRTPMARIVPISLVRSITFMVIVLTTANSTITLMTTAMNRKIDAEKRTDLAVERRQLAEVTHLEVEALCLEQLLQPRARRRQVLAAVQLQHDAGHLVLAPAVDELLRQREIHARHSRRPFP